MTTSNSYLTFLRSWFWIIALGIVISVVATYYALSDRVPLYSTTATLQVGRTLQDKNPAQDDLMVIDRLIPTYGAMAQRDPVLNATIQALGLPFSPDDVRSRLLIIPVSRTQLIDLHVIDADPEVAAAIANEIARQVVLQSPNTETEEDTSAFVQAQLDDLQAKIMVGREEALAIESDIAVMTSAAEVFDARERANVINAQIDTWQQTYASLVVTLEPSTSNIVSVASAATLPTAPLPAQTNLYYGLGVVTGGGLGTLLALGLSVVGRNIRSADELVALAGDIPIVTIPRYNTRGANLPITVTQPESVATGAYRVLRNTLQTVGVDTGTATLVVTSTKSGEGKTTTVANLGAALANTGLFVILVDTNFRNPELDQLFGLDGKTGFSDLLLSNSGLRQAIQPTGHPNLSIVSIGAVPANYTDLLSSSRMESLVEVLSTKADVVIFDTPAVEQEQETQLLARHVGGVLVLAEAGGVKSEDLRHTLTVLDRAGANVLSIALNKAQHRYWSVERLPWSRAARRRASADRRRKRRTQSIQSDSRPNDAHPSIGAAD